LVHGLAWSFDDAEEWWSFDDAEEWSKDHHSSASGSFSRCFCR
jgi:hypothetical protein